MVERRVDGVDYLWKDDIPSEPSTPNRMQEPKIVARRQATSIPHI
jgi:hypothetical protein